MNAIKIIEGKRNGIAVYRGILTINGIVAYQTNWYVKSIRANSSASIAHGLLCDYARANGVAPESVPMSTTDELVREYNASFRARVAA